MKSSYARMLHSFEVMAWVEEVMPRKKRQIRADYRAQGFIERQGKGDYTVFSHPLLRENYAVDGKDGADVLPYDELKLRRAIRLLAEAKKRLQL